MSQRQTKSIVFIGASRGCGLHALLEALKGSNGDLKVTTLLRQPKNFKALPEYLELSNELQNRIEIVQGDAFKGEDVQKVLDRAGPELDTVISSIGLFFTFSS